MDVKTKALSPKPGVTGRREGNKADKLRRIRTAARDLFVQQGFDGTTMRDIAALAGVGFGTLFDYASNKRDLLFLIYNPQLERVLEEGLASVASEDLLIDKLMALFGGYYALHGRDRALSRAMLRELTFFNEGTEAQKFVLHRSQFLDAVYAQIRTAIAQGQLTVDEPIAIGQIIFAIYAWEIRRWLADESPSIARGLSDLRRLLLLQIVGFK